VNLNAGIKYSSTFAGGSVQRSFYDACSRQTPSITATISARAHAIDPNSLAPNKYHHMPHKLMPLILTVALLGCSNKPIPEHRVTPDVESVVKGNNDFALDLYAKLSAEQPGNLFFSPYSLSLARAMTYAGARGETEKEMAEVMRFTLPQEQLHPTFAALTEDIGAHSEQQGYQLDVANRLWGQNGCGFLPEFLRITRDDYGAELGQVEFASNTEGARQEINAWAQKLTKGKIKELFVPGVLNEATVLVLTNAIYFKADWATQFEREHTRDAPFHVSTEEEIYVPMMSQMEMFNFAETEDLKVLEMPYTGDVLSMLILLPNTVDGLPELEEKLTADNLATWFGGLHQEEVDVSFPKFAMTSQFRLDEVLKSMGMSSAFVPGKADLSGMNGSNDLFLQAVIHKAFVEVNEEGTEAAAVTADDAADDAGACFQANHPFLFLIRHNPTNCILFMGRVVNPEEQRQ
jgi:serine protease inhibitor